MTAIANLNPLLGQYTRADSHPILQDAASSARFAELLADRRDGDMAERPPGQILNAVTSASSSGTIASPQISEAVSGALPGNAADARSPEDVGPTYQFAELGMFGRFAAQSWDGVSTVSAPATFAGLGPRGAEIAPKDAATPTSVLDVQSDAFVPFEPSAGVVTAPPEPSAPAMLLGGGLPAMATFLAPASGNAQEVGPFEPIGSAGQVAPDYRPAPANASPATSELAMTADGTGLNIVARGADLSEADAAGVRRMLEAAAAEFGMQVSELHLNGASVAPSSSRLGGLDGHRTR